MLMLSTAFCSAKLKEPYQELAVTVGKLNSKPLETGRVIHLAHSLDLRKDRGPQSVIFTCRCDLLNVEKASSFKDL